MVVTGVALLRKKEVKTTPLASVDAGQRNVGLAWAGNRAFRVLRRDYEDPAQSQCSFYLTPVDGAALPGFRPGQYLTFALAIQSSQSSTARTVTRCYSLSDQPEPGQYRVTIKRVPAPADQPDLPPGVSSSFFHDQVRVGDTLMLKAPSGHFYIDADSTTPVVLIGGGIGITPMLSMLRWCLTYQPGRHVHLYYGVRNQSEHAFKAQLEQLALRHSHMHLHVVYSRPGSADRLGVDFQHVGHISVDLLRLKLPHGRHQFYICGPSVMMESLVPALANWGVPVADIHFEAFGPASVRLPDAIQSVAASAGMTGASVHFSQSGRSLQWDGTDANLLDFAERHGISVESGCRSGGCGACQVRLKQGTVAYAMAPDHDVAPGHCLLCVGTPASALDIEA